MSARATEAEAEAEEPSLRSGAADRAAGPAAPPPDAKTALFREGLDRLRRLTGLNRDRAASLLGRLLRECGDDCSLLSLILAEGEDAQPASPEDWLFGAIRSRRGGGVPRNGAAPPRSKLAWMNQPGAFERMAAE